MSRTHSLAGAAAALIFTTTAFGPALADEGMWTFDNFPAAKVQAAYGVKIDQPWLDRVQAAAVRIPGCSASLVSKSGLVLTNNHCVVGCTTALSSPGHDYVHDGYMTDAMTEEGKCPGMTAEVLVSITDVTDQIKAAGEGKVGQAYVQAREAAERFQAQAANKEAEARRKAAETPKRPRKLTLKERTELEGIESAILNAETAAEDIETKLHDPAFQAANYAEIPALVEKLDAAKAEVARLYQRWEELEALKLELEG